MKPTAAAKLRALGGQHHSDMFTYQQQPRTLHRISGDVPPFPASVKFELTLDPSHVFGEGTGDLPILMANRDFTAEWSGLTGRAVHKQNPPIAPFAFGGPLGDGNLVLMGSVVTVERHCTSLAECIPWLDTLRLVIPAVLAVFLPRPVSVASARVLVGDAVFTSQIRRAVSALEYTTEESYHERARSALVAVDAVWSGGHHALVAASAYVHVAERLAEVGTGPSEFMPEMVLNLVKVLEVLFGSSRDGIREGLAALGYAESEREGVFMPLVILRNEMDVGHAKLSSYSADVLDQVYGFVLDAPLAMKELVVRALNATIAGSWQPPRPSEPSTAADMERIVQAIKMGTAARRQRVGNRPYLVFKYGSPEAQIITPAT